jgi:hypothetical protein
MNLREKIETALKRRVEIRNPEAVAEEILAIFNEELDRCIDAEDVSNLQRSVERV